MKPDENKNLLSRFEAPALMPHTDSFWTAFQSKLQTVDSAIDQFINEAKEGKGVQNIYEMTMEKTQRKSEKTSSSTALIPEPYLGSTQSEDLYYGKGLQDFFKVSLSEKEIDFASSTILEPYEFNMEGANNYSYFLGSENTFDLNLTQSFALPLEKKPISSSPRIDVEAQTKASNNFLTYVNPSVLKAPKPLPMPYLNTANKDVKNPKKRKIKRKSYDLRPRKKRKINHRSSPSNMLKLNPSSTSDCPIHGHIECLKQGLKEEMLEKKKTTKAKGSVQFIYHPEFHEIGEKHVVLLKIISVDKYKDYERQGAKPAFSAAIRSARLRLVKKHSYLLHLFSHKNLMALILNLGSSNQLGYKISDYMDALFLGKLLRKDYRYRVANEEEAIKLKSLFFSSGQLKPEFTQGGRSVTSTNNNNSDKTEVKEKYTKL